MVSRKRTRYYLLPCMFFFSRSSKLLKLVLKMMGSLVKEKSSSGSSQQWTQYTTGYSRRIDAIVSVLLLIFADIKVRKNLLVCQAEIKQILDNILQLQVLAKPFYFKVACKVYINSCIDPAAENSAGNHDT